MNSERLVVTVEIEELSFLKGETVFKGRLCAVRPSRSKPRDITSEVWAVALLRAANEGGKFLLAIPRSFCSSDGISIVEQAGLADTRWIDLMDQPNYQRGSSPIEAVREIIDALSDGEDVLVLSNTKRRPGFVSAVLSKLCEPIVHVEKVLHTVTSYRYELTPFQVGYIYGISDGH